MTILLYLSLHKDNKKLITNDGAVKSLIYALKTTRTKTSKHKTTCTLLRLALVGENKSSSSASGLESDNAIVTVLLNEQGKEGCANDTL
ncbi:Armadillo-like helical [Sesbania bispinosa]|nr:Armadillo-like helical [Sesbania bispinosa]